MSLWWKRLSIFQRVIFVGLLVCLLGLAGSLVFDWPFWPFSIVGFVFVVINFVMIARAVWSPVPGRPDLDKSDR